MSAHTPGPWKIATTYALDQKGQCDVVPWASQRQRICRIRARPDYPAIQAAADACLIAAAPDMLEQLHATHVFLSECILPSYAADHPMRTHIRTRLGVIRAAIQLATEG